MSTFRHLINIQVNLVLQLKKFFHKTQYNFSFYRHLRYTTKEITVTSFSELFVSKLFLFFTYLSVFLVPKILTKQRNVVLAEKSHRRYWFDCETTGYPRPFIEWVFGKKTLNATSGEIIGVMELISLHPTVNIITSSYEVFKNGSLLIRNPYLVNHFQYDIFTCVASSILGEDRKSHSFAIEPGKC